MKNPTRADAIALLREFNEKDRSIRHALAVEAAMRFMARKKSEDQETWGIAGLLHDLDFERFPEQHCAKAGEIMEERGWPPSLVRAVLSHGWGICSDVEPQTEMEKTLYAVDELTGLVSAAALVRPTRSVLDMTPKSVKKKWKDKRFAAGVDRTIIERGATMLGVELSDLITDVIEAMREVAGDIGLAGRGGD